jgi:2-octaprenyl-6-methoxyphenol hydroxylase
MVTDQFDIAIAGSGPVGGALALALREAGLRVAVVSPHAAYDAPTSNAAAPPRPIALSYASHALLSSLGMILPSHGTPIRTVHVSQRHGFGRTLLAASDHGLPALGYVFESGALEHAARTCVAPWRVGERVIAWASEADRVVVTLTDGPATRTLTARVLVLADGGALSSIEIVRDYGQAALLGTVRTLAPHGGRAWERFTAGGPLALLPLGARYAFVWALPQAEAQARLADADSAFCAALQAQLGDRLGTFSAVSARTAVPLVLRRLRAPTDPRVVAIGNAAQTLHPVAGQGLNLGLRDAAELAAAICAATPGEIGDEAFVRHFAAARWLDRSATIGVTDLFVRVFSNSSPILAPLRGIGLGLLDAVTPARTFLARRMMLGARALP